MTNATNPVAANSEFFISVSPVLVACGRSSASRWLSGIADEGFVADAAALAGIVEDQTSESESGEENPPEPPV